MRRREFIAGLGSAAAWPVMAHAQQSDRVRRVGVLMGADENNPEAKARFSEFMKELAELGWTDGRNLQIDIRRAGANADRARYLILPPFSGRNRTARSLLLPGFAGTPVRPPRADLCFLGLESLTARNMVRTGQVL